MILGQEALHRLPELGRQDMRRDPIAYIKLSAPFPDDPEKKWQCYIVEGGYPRGDSKREYEVFALFVGKYGHNWAQLPLSSIDEDLRDAKLIENLKKETDFQPAAISTCAGNEFLRTHIA